MLVPTVRIGTLDGYICTTRITTVWANGLAQGRSLVISGSADGIVQLTQMTSNDRIQHQPSVHNFWNFGLNRAAIMQSIQQGQSMIGTNQSIKGPCARPVVVCVCVNDFWGSTVCRFMCTEFKNQEAMIRKRIKGRNVNWKCFPLYDKRGQWQEITNCHKMFGLKLATPTMATDGWPIRSKCRAAAAA